ncbi:restriction endonuclease subunit S [Collinsella sp. BG-O-102]|uniref:restriction endonuclease subunit S n=1 Tax=Collinsella sp. BG-O-102 TaxID=2949659 RepID=UPI00202EF1C2|nr:restriction endonuclease subunit S [Collinsella sp. BG-O-102]MCM0709278.1 restriction endonuclease subunit S [Collinsella sp. BG-O-102]
MKAKDLKNSILQMAIEGKLVPQDPNDEPASVLLKRIREEKHRLIAEGKAKFPKGGESIIYIGSDGSPYEKRVDAKGRVLSDRCIADEVPFEELPEGWAWARLESLCSVITDGDHQAPPQQADGIPFLVISDVSSGKIDFSNTRHVSSNYFDSLDGSRKPRYSDLLLTVTGSFGIVVPVNTEERFCFQRHIALLRPLGYRRFMINALAAPSTYAYFNAKATGTAQKTVSLGCLRSTLLALPPENEEPRIINQLTQLMPLVEEYGELEDAREALDAALPGRLRKSVLQLAVQGGLVPQDPADEPAGVLLERIRGQRRQLVAEGKMRAPKGGESIIFAGSDGRRYEKRVDAKGRESEPVCIEDEIPFEIPEGWEWRRLGSLVLNRGQKRPEARFAYIDISSIDNVNQKLGQETVINAADAPSRARKLVAKNDVLYATVRPYLHNACIVDKDFNIEPIASTGFAVLSCLDGFLPSFLLYFLVSPSFDSYANANENAKGVAYPAINDNRLYRALIPVPPASEQKRIVSRITEVFALTN